MADYFIHNSQGHVRKVQTGEANSSLEQTSNKNLYQTIGYMCGPPRRKHWNIKKHHEMETALT